MSKTDVIREVEQKFGSLPLFYKNVPEVAIEPLWGMMRDAVLAETAIPRRIKSLLGVTSAAALQDPYRNHLAHEMATAAGCSPEEINEAIAKAGETVLFSSWVNGIQYDYDKFRKEVRAGLDNVAAKNGVIPPPPRLDNRSEVISDIQNIFGVALGFFEQMPDPILRHAWKLMRNVSLAETLIPAKYKELMSIGVASALSCRYCSYFHTEAARLHGATEDEIKETVGFVAHARYFTTMLNGQRYDQDQFRKDVRPMVATMRKLVGSSGR